MKEAVGSLPCGASATALVIAEKWPTPACILSPLTDNQEKTLTGGNQTDFFFFTMTLVFSTYTIFL